MWITNSYFYDPLINIKNEQPCLTSWNHPWQAIGEEFLEKVLNITDEEVEAKNRNDFSNSEKTGSSFQNEANKGSSIEENIDEIEATLAKLKKELGL